MKTNYRTATAVTLHCLSGCALGEISGMIITTAIGLGNALNVIISLLLSFVFGYSFTMFPLLREQTPFKKALLLALAADSVSITSMELLDNGFILIVPNALSAGLTTALFWISLLVSLVLAFIMTVPVNKYLLDHGKGHAVLHSH